MPGLRILLRIAPFFVGALAVAVWLRRRHAERTPLPPAPARPLLEPSSAPTAPKLPDATPEFAGEPVSIVTIVDDLLETGR